MCACVGVCLYVCVRVCVCVCVCACTINEVELLLDANLAHNVNLLARLLELDLVSGLGFRV